MLLKDMMSKDVPLLSKGDSIARAVFLFRHSKVNLLPVVDKDMRLVGVFTRKNFLDALLQKATVQPAQ